MMKQQRVATEDVNHDTSYSSSFRAEKLHVKTLYFSTSMEQVKAESFTLTLPK